MSMIITYYYIMLPIGYNCNKLIGNIKYELLTNILE